MWGAIKFIEKVSEDRKVQRDTKSAIEKIVSESVMEEARQHYRKNLVKYFETMDLQSQEFWTRHTESLKTDLLKMVGGSDALEYDQREELKQIIINYQKLTYDDNRERDIFRTDEFEDKIAIGNFILWKSNRLNLKKMEKTLNEQINTEVLNRYKNVRKSDETSASNWIEELLNKIKDNIIQYNPDLSEQNQSIQKLTRDIEALEVKQHMLNDYANELEKMIDWKKRQSV